MLHNIVDNRESKREEKALDEKKKKKQEKTRELIEGKMDREPKSRAAYRRSNRRDWLDSYEEEEEV